MRNPRTAQKPPRISKTLERLLRNLYRTEPLEQRILLSADPVAALIQQPERDGDAMLVADPGAMVIAWDEISRGATAGGSVPADEQETTDFPVDQAAFDALQSPARASFMDTSLAEEGAAFDRFMGGLLASFEALCRAR